MHDLDDDTLIGLAEFRKMLHLSPSGERRMRSEQQDWPPHLSLGRRVFYFRDGVRDFLMRQEVQNQAARETRHGPAAEFQSNQNCNCQHIERNPLS